MFGLFGPGLLSRYSEGLWAGRPGFDSRKGQEIFLYSTSSRPALGPAQPPTQWVPGALSLGVKQQGRATDHSPPINAEIKNGSTVPPLPHTSSSQAA
jgi:hypothetical protein